MTLLQIFIFVAFALLVAWLRRSPGRIVREVCESVIRWILLAASLLAVYWMQPSMPVRYLDFWLPTATLGLAVMVWAATREKSQTDDKRERRENWWGAAVVAATMLLVGLTRYLPDPTCCLTPTHPPDMWKIIAVIGVLGLATISLVKASTTRRFILHLFTLLIIGLFILLKTEPLAQMAAAGLRSLSGQSTHLASVLDIRWLGFSYIAFRLIHTLRDRLAGKLPSLSLREFITYIIFFPAITAGPIDRVQRFTQDLRKLESLDISSGCQRILIGIFKKFAIADSMALIALNASNALQSKPGIWMWVLLYAYALRIYFDFSSYTDIAIGLGKLMGFNLPENFEHPYLKSNLTTFWNSWHITLAQWFRAYFFNPLTRAMRSGGRYYPVWLVVLIGQLSTMLLIGLWHGITLNFAAWGLWHGAGLFIHNRWSDATRARFAGLVARPQLQRSPLVFRAVSAAGTLITFHYVVLGWVWFALPSMDLSWKVFLKLMGF